MKTYLIKVPKADKYIPKVDKVDVFVELLGFGSENPVKRSELVLKCIDAGIVNPDTKDPDRAMRNILERARIDYAILNDGKEYYRPTARDRERLAKNNAREKSRALNILSSTKVARAFEEDCKFGRITE